MAGNDKTPLAKRSDIKKTSTPFALSLLGFLLPNLSSGPLLDTPPCLDRPSTPLGFRAEDDDKEQEIQESSGRSLESICTRLVSEAWAGIPLSHDEETDGCVPDIVCPVPRTKVLPSITQELTESRARKQRALSHLRYHGHSQSALTDYKVFWNARYEEWARWQTELEETEFLAYDGIQKSSPRLSHEHTPVSEAETTGRYRGEYIPDVEAPIYPRTGNLASLRQPSALEHERLFIDFPLHKIHKILFAYDMDHRSELGRKDEKQDSLEEHEGDLSFASNEITLVEEHQAPEELKEESLLSDVSGPKYQEAGAWEVDWNVKWELLMELIRRHEEDAQACDLSDVCREYLQGDMTRDEQEDDQDDYITYTDYSAFDELLIC